MKIFYLLFILGLTSLSASAQQEAILGKWKFKEVYNLEKFDSMGLKMAKQMFGEMTVYLKPDKRYTTNFFVKENGSWEYNAAAKKLTLTADKGTIADWDLEVLTKETILVSFALNKSIVMSKVPTDATDETKEENNQVLVTVQPKMICQKWFLKSRSVPGKTAEETQKITDIFEGAFFYFAPDNSYASHIGKLNDEGVWELANNSQTIILQANNEKKYWNVKSISKTELVLYRGRTEETWTFSTQE